MCLYLAGSAIGRIGITGTAVWCGVALAVIIAISGTQRIDVATMNLDRAWPFALLGVGLLIVLVTARSGRARGSAPRSDQAAGDPDLPEDERSTPPQD